MTTLRPFLRAYLHALALAFVFVLPLFARQLSGDWPGALVFLSPVSSIPTGLAGLVVAGSTFVLVAGLLLRWRLDYLAIAALPLIATSARLLLLCV